MRFTKVDYDKDRADKLTNRLLTDPHSLKTGVLANDLLTEFHRGYPLQNLRPLLLNEDHEVATLGAWFASELGEKGKPLLDVAPILLKHPERKVRFSAIDCILVWAEPVNQVELASVICLLDDPESSVRWKAMDFLMRASMEQLEAALAYLEATATESSHVQGLRWLLSTNALEPKEVVSILQSSNGLLRKYGAVAAARMFVDNREPLAVASSINDLDIQQFAESRRALV